MGHRKFEVSEKLADLLDDEQVGNNIDRNYKPKEADTTMDTLVLELAQEEPKKKKPSFFKRLFGVGGD